MTATSSRYERLAQRNFFEEILALRDLQRKQKATAEIMVRGDDLPWELNRQGYTRWYMAPTMEDVVMNTYVMYVQRIPPHSRSGKQLMQGGQIGFIWEGGKGYSIIDGERYDWGHWDLIQVPLRVRGCVVQHFNDSDDDVQIIFASVNNVNSAGVDRGCGFEQLEDCPEYREQKRREAAPA